MTIDEPAIKRAATLCAMIYDSPNGFEHTHPYRPFRFPGGELFCGLRRYDRDAYVVFRGTLDLGQGNWLWTNFQAFAAADPDSAASGQRVHQGFVRAFLWLWKNEEFPWRRPAVADEIKRWVRYLVCAAVLALINALLLWRVGSHYTLQRLIACLGGIVVTVAWATAAETLFLIAWARGWHEWLGRNPLGSKNDSPSTRWRMTLAGAKRVYFVGHSLGGAMALLALNDYRSGNHANKDEARAITFGAPRLGNAPFLKAFENDNPDHFLNIVDRADPVPRMPPAGGSALLRGGTARPRPRNLLMACVLALIYVPWSVWARCFGVSYQGDWTGASRLEIGKPGLWLGAHGMKGYCKSLGACCCGAKAGRDPQEPAKGGSTTIVV